MAQVILYIALILLSICIFLSHCRTLETSKQYRSLFAPKQIEKNLERRSIQQKPLIRVKRNPPTPTTPTYPSKEYASYEVIPYVNTGSSYFNADGTQVKAPVFNYGFYNYPYFLAPQYRAPNYQPDYDDDDYSDQETQTSYYDAR